MELDENLILKKAIRSDGEKEGVKKQRSIVTGQSTDETIETVNKLLGGRLPVGPWCTILLKDCPGVLKQPTSPSSH